MTTTAPPRLTALAALADEARLDVLVDLCRTDDATIGDVTSLLATAGRLLPQGLIDPMRTSGILSVAVSALYRFSDDTRSAPPKGLADAVAEFGERCGNEECSERVAPWANDSVFCSDSCRGAVAE